MTHKFSDVPRVQIQRSSFNRSHGYKTTFDASYLVPFFVDEVLPGDTFSVKATGFARLSTPIYPIMDNMFMDTFFFAVPNRLVWENFAKFCGEQVDPGDSTDYTVPIVNDLNNAANETIFDYFGLPTKVAAVYEFNALPLRCYNLIWNEWFRDQNLQDSVKVNTGDGPDSEADYTLLKRCKKHDYFTSCLPWLQKGDAVLLSLGDSAPIFGDGMAFDAVHNTGNYAQVRDAQGSGANLRLLKADSTNVYGHSTSSGSSELMADLSEAIGPTVNELRQAIQVQMVLERNARSGTRYKEIIQSHFGVTSPDSRLQRPEYLGGGSSPINITPIARTDSSPGVLAAMGTAHFTNHGFTKSFVEHCTIIGLVNVRADIFYQEGLDRMWSRQTMHDFYWPSYAHLGEQAVLNKEIYIDAAMIGAGTEDDVFGYQERFAEYRYKPSKVTGKFRSNDAASLDAWHLGIEFGALPTLDDTFIQDNPPVDRVIATPTEPHFIFDSYISMNCVRPMPVYSEPRLVAHF